ncbi:hypothetical protein K435DRAFT_704703 [Dendrothele bispora CBS 962.96]|uniref:DUF6533 domain-containing protein n=1 Tax=Dendrothele bispora (strain CBS 962.96) TaxID=1314807 RepID=A0A4S8KMS7_DENBC|nr:hypothetical protein K435DRAFT_704703 [Dendrothele bispora CBS 962.96]
MNSWLAVSAGTLILYDYFLTIGREIELIWFSDWNAVKVLYLIQRYLSFVDVIHVLSGFFISADIRSSMSATQVLMTFGLAVSEAILSIRTWAMWKDYRLVKLAIPVYFTGGWIFCTVFAFLFANSIGLIYAPSPGLNGCWAISGNNYFLLGSWFVFLTFESGRRFFNSHEDK